MTFKDSNQAFQEAITAGRLSDIPGQSNYAGNYMYMGTEGRRDLFKNIQTREYLKAEGVEPRPFGAADYKPITTTVRGLPVYVDTITDGDGIPRRLSRPIRLL